MKKCNHSLFLLCLFGVLSCTHEDSIIPNTSSVVLLEKVSGNVLIDEDFDGIGDIPLVGSRVYLGDFMLIRDILGQRPDTIGALYEDVLWADTDDNGNYLFEGVAPVESQSLVLYSPLPNVKISGTDNSPDGDLQEEEIAEMINITVDENEHDDGNNFIVQIIDEKAKISGYVMIDSNKDGLVDKPGDYLRIQLYYRDDNGNPSGGPLSIATVYTDHNGYYEFNDIDEGNYVVNFASIGNYTMMFSGDTSEDMDPILPSTSYWIPVDIIDKEHDSDNNFDIAPRWISGSGYVLLDTDGDGTGDVPIDQQRVELYNRDANGAPTGNLIQWDNTDSSGFYKFQNISPGEYVIYYIGSPEFQCVSSSDRTPEPGEPTMNSQCFFIQMDLQSLDSEDYINVFIVRAI